MEHSTISVRRDMHVQKKTAISDGEFYLLLPPTGYLDALCLGILECKDTTATDSGYRSLGNSAMSLN
jgi:hypothetical protein